jgi:hypothetical protein
MCNLHWEYLSKRNLHVCAKSENPHVWANSCFVPNAVISYGLMYQIIQRLNIVYISVVQMFPVSNEGVIHVHDDGLSIILTLC